MSFDPLVHVVREAAGEPAGALVLLHGRGADEHDLYRRALLIHPERRLVGLTPRAPLPGPGPKRRALVVHGAARRLSLMPPTFHSTSVGLTVLSPRRLQGGAIGWERTMIGGFSMGCVMS